MRKKSIRIDDFEYKKNEKIKEMGSKRSFNNPIA